MPIVEFFMSSSKIVENICTAVCNCLYCFSILVGILANHGPMSASAAAKVTHEYNFNDS